MVSNIYCDVSGEKSPVVGVANIRGGVGGEEPSRIMKVVDSA